MITLVIGGAACGKSAYAEALCMQLDQDDDREVVEGIAAEGCRESRKVYLATMRPFGEEGAARVRKHRAQRAGKGFTTIECYESLANVVDDERVNGSIALLEDLGNVVANELFAEWEENTSLAHIVAIADRADHLVIVGNEVGADGVSYPVETVAYQQCLAELTRALAKRCDRVVECCAGIPTVIK